MVDSADDADARVAAMAGELRVLIAKLGRRLREQTQPGDLTFAQNAVLHRLERMGSATVTTLAKAEGVRPQSMGATVAALQAAGLVVGAPDPADGRQTLLSLTDDCRDWVRAGRAARTDWLANAIRSRVPTDEHQELAAAVDLLRRLLDS